MEVSNHPAKDVTFDEQFVTVVLEDRNEVTVGQEGPEAQ